MDTPKPYWFPAKRHGWGWGPPVTWQGWVVLAVFLLLLVAGFVRYPPVPNPVAFIVYVAVLTAALVFVCLLKGEPPAWRWGDE
jgi:hypothetical protein